MELPDSAPSDLHEIVRTLDNAEATLTVLDSHRYANDQLIGAIRSHRRILVEEFWERSDPDYAATAASDLERDDIHLAILDLDEGLVEIPDDISDLDQD